MFGLERLADAFDRFHAVWDTAVDLAATDYVDEYSRVWGPDDWRTQGVAVQAGVLWALNAFVGGTLAGFADVARLGQGVKKRTFGGFAHDGLRLLTFAGPAMQVVRRGGALLIAGNQVSQSCVMTSNAFALRLSATRIGITIDGLARAGGMKPPTSTAGYVGEMADDIAIALKAVGARVQRQKLPNVPTLQDIERLVRADRGPVVFEANQYVVGKIEPIGAHAMTAFRDLLGRVMVADQYGIRPLSKFNEIKGVVAPLANILITDAYIIENAVVVRNANALSALPGVASAAQIAIEAFHVPGPSLIALDDAVRGALKRPTRAQEREARRKTLVGTGDGAMPLAASPIKPDEFQLLGLIPPRGEITREQAMARSGFDASRLRLAVSGLEAAKRIVVRRDAPDPLTIVSMRRP